MGFSEKEKNTTAILYGEMDKNENEIYTLLFEDGNKIDVVLDTAYEADTDMDFEDMDVEYEEYLSIVVEVVNVLTNSNNTFRKGMLYEIRYFNFPIKIENSKGKIIYINHTICKNDEHNHLLKIRKIIDTKQPIIEFDPYIPFTIKFRNGYTREELKYICLRNDKSILEIGIINNNEIYEITLVHFNKSHTFKTIELENKTVIGLPILNYIEFERYYSNIESYFKVGIIEKSVYVLFTENKVYKTIQNYNVHFLCDENDCIIGIGITGINDENLKLLKQHFI